jgi:hypothetical protein
MKSTHTKFLLMGAFLASIIFIGVGAAPATKQSGSDPYTPTKLEWFKMWADTKYRIDFGQYGPYAIGFINGKTRNSIMIYCGYKNTVDRRELNEAIAHARSELAKEAKFRGWDKWLKIEEHLVLQK